MNHASITIPVRLDGKTFRRFARFDAFALRRRHRRPLLFAAIFVFFALVAFLSRRPQSALLGGVLLVVGLGLPAVYIGSFLSGLRRQAKALGAGQRVYTVRLDGDGVSVRNDRKEEAPLRLPWPEVRQAFRMADCIYLYVSPAKAFLLPAGQASVPDDELWAFLLRYLGREKCQTGRRA